MSDSNSGLTRRRFLELVGSVGGSAALYETMTALGLINVPEAWAGPPQIPRGAGAGKTVLILGAGIGGLTTAYMLTNAGYQCEIVEAQDRAGGRSLTARRGTVVAEDGKNGKTTQTCKFDEGLYLNMGPGRLPYHHRRVLHYCQELDVPLEVYVMETMANLFQTKDAFRGAALPARRLAYDTQGYISELLSKAIRKKALDEELNEGDREKLLCLLKDFGDLGEGDECAKCGKEKCKNCNTNCTECMKCGLECRTCFDYSGSTRTGCDAPLTVYHTCMPGPKLPLQELLRSEFWQHRFYQSIEYEWQPTLFQPVGGMDQIVEGFKRKVGHLIKYQTEVTYIQLRPDGVEVTCRDAVTGEKCMKRADYCVSNIPTPVLKDIDNTFSDGFKRAIKNAEFEAACKVGWQANERFWESNQYEIYGGISYIDDIITQMWYPSNGYFTKKGTLTGAYIYEPQSIAFGDMTLKRRLEIARQGAKKLHPEFDSNRIVPEELGLSIAWQNIPFQRGGWANWNPDNQEHQEAYRKLLEPDGRFFVVGDQVSTLPGWQEGAMMSAEHVVSQIVPVLLAAPRRPAVIQVPNTRRVVQGR